MTKFVFFLGYFFYYQCLSIIVVKIDASKLKGLEREEWREYEGFAWFCCFCLMTYNHNVKLLVATFSILNLVLQ